MQDENIQPEQLGGSTGSPDDSALLTPELREDLSTGLIALGCVLLMIFTFRMLRRKASKSAATEAEPRRPEPRAAAQPSHERLEQLMADAEELTRRLAAILDNKAARLETLIEQADERVRVLEAAAAAPAPKPARPAERASPPEPEPRDPVDPFHRKVYELADQGLAPVDIARKIDRPTGQVELILALRRA